MELHLTAGDAAVLTGALLTAKTTLLRELDEGIVPIEHRRAVLEGIDNVNTMLNKVERLIQDDMNKKRIAPGWN